MQIIDDSGEKAKYRNLKAEAHVQETWKLKLGNENT